MSDKIQARREIELSAVEGQLLRRADGRRSVRLREFRARTAKHAKSAMVFRFTGKRLCGNGGHDFSTNGRKVAGPIVARICSFIRWIKKTMSHRSAASG